MCDQDHFEEDRQEFERLGLVTRKQFGMMLGAGVAMLLPTPRPWSNRRSP
jgi:carboxymethylenebutenolidase